MTGEQKALSGIQRQRKLPNREAIKIAARSLKIRFWRSLITIAGIILAIAFLTYVLVFSALTKEITQALGEDVVIPAQSQATQIWLIGISLLVCVVGISNAMLMSVTERFREIGTMKCLGALDWFVVKLFLIEAGFQGLVGSFVGAALGVMAAFVLALAQHGGGLVFAEAPWGMVFLYGFGAVLTGGVLSILGAIYPAHRAGKMPPADAMRAEM